MMLVLVGLINVPFVSGSALAAPPVLIKVSVVTPDSHFVTRQYAERGKLVERYSKASILPPFAVA